jgi:hypothetical protein
MVVQKGGSRGRQGMTAPAEKGVPPGQGKRAGTGTRSVIMPPMAGGGSRTRGACDDKRILPDIRNWATALRTNRAPRLVPFVHKIPSCGRRRPRCGRIAWRARALFGVIAGSTAAGEESDLARGRAAPPRRLRRRIERLPALWYRNHPPWRRSSAGQSSGIIIRVS